MVDRDRYLKKLIAIYSGIPDGEWCTHRERTDDRRACCAFGHLLFRKGPDGLFHRRRGLEHLKDRGRAWIRPTLRIAHLSEVNDNEVKDYKKDLGKVYRQDSPKARVLAYLHDLLATPQLPTPTKQG